MPRPTPQETAELNKRLADCAETLDALAEMLKGLDRAFAEALQPLRELTLELGRLKAAYPEELSDER